ncbi:hypothetical protein C8F01DRAFT_1266023 [Mycena amicta]|nr:hypothetical protein C8F01DRAFT_1266023 [Mycena amicta]
MAAFSGPKKIGTPAYSAQASRLAFSAPAFTIEPVANGALYKAMTVHASGVQLEGIFTLVGVLGEKLLPPMRWDSILASKPANLSQRLTLYGMDSDAFERGIDFINTIDFHLAEKITAPVKTFLSSSSDSTGRGKSLDIDTRFFTRDRKPIPVELQRAFSPLVDPVGALKSLQTPTLAHCVDNVVHYLAMKEGRVIQHDPAVFVQGDIVEVGFAIHAFRAHSSETGPYYLAKLVMRSVMLLDQRFSKAPNAAALHNHKRKRIADAIVTSERKWKSIKSSANPLADLFADDEEGKGEAEDESDGEEFQDTRMELEQLHLETKTAQ